MEPIRVGDTYRLKAWCRHHVRRAQAEPAGVAYSITGMLADWPDRCAERGVLRRCDRCDALRRIGALSPVPRQPGVVRCTGVCSQRREWSFTPEPYWSRPL